MSEGVARFYFVVLQDWFCRGHELLCPQNECPANPEVGHGMIKILKSLNFARIGAPALSNELRRESEVHDFCMRRESGVNDPWKEKENKPFIRDSSRNLDYPATGWILEQLRKPVPKETEKAIELAEELRRNIEALPEKVRPHLVACLEPEHVSTMWEIAGYNCFDSAADMLPSVKGKPPVSVKGKIHRNSGNWPSPTMGNIFRNPTFEMTFFCDNNSHVYGQIKGGMKGSFYLIREDANGDSLCKKPCHLTFEYRNGDQRFPEHHSFLATTINKVTKLITGEKQVFPFDDNVKPAEQPKQFMDKLLIIRCAGPNVLVGQTRPEDESVLVGQARPEAECISGEIVLIKKC